MTRVRFRRWVAVTSAVILSLAAAMGLLLYPTTLVLNILGVIVVASHAVAIFIVVNPRLPARAAWAGYLLVSGVICYWGWLSPFPDRFPVRGMLHWDKYYDRPLVKLWWDIRALVAESPLTTVPGRRGTFAYLWSQEFHFDAVGILLTAVFAGLAAAFVCHRLAALWRRRTSPPADATTSSPRRWLQFDLRSLCIYTLVILLITGWVVREREQTLRFKRAWEALQAKNIGTASEVHCELFPWLNHLVRHDTYHLLSLEVDSGTDDLKLLSDLPLVSDVQLTSEIDDEDFQMLSRLRGLKALRLGPAVSEAALDRLEPLHLKRLSVRAVDLGDKGLTAISRMKDLKALHIGVSGARPSDEALQLLANLLQLEELSCSDIPLHGEQARFLARLPRLRELTAKIDDDGLQYLAHTIHLEELRVFESKVSDRGLRHLAALSHLRRLDVSGEITDASMEWIGRNRSLRSLQMPACQITDAGAKHLAHLTELQALVVGSPEIGDDTLLAIGKLSQLTLLIVPRSQITDAGVQSLPPLPHLHDLMLTHCEITAASLAEANKFPSLQMFGVRDTHILPADIQAAGKMKFRVEQ
jgi:hypothetical protein